MDGLGVAVGARVRAARVANHQTQAVVAGLAGITADYLYQIERGKKVPTLPILLQLADALRLPVEALVGRAEPRAAATKPGHAAAAGAVYRALTAPITESSTAQFEGMAGRVQSAWATWQTSPNRYSTLSVELPDLVSDLTLAQRQVTAAGEQRRAVHRCAADLYGLVRTFAKRVGRGDLSLLAADRAVRAAEAADDPQRQAVAQWNLAHVLLADDEPDGAEAVALDAATWLARECGADEDGTALCAALTLLAGIAAARRRDRWAARERVHEALPVAQRIGEGNPYWTVFGPTNVAMYAVSVEVEVGEAAEALRLAERVDHRGSPSIERRVAFLLEQAKGHAQRRDLGSTLALLQTAGREAPEDLAYRSTARELLRTVVHRGSRGVAAEAAYLADQVGAPVS